MNYEESRSEPTVYRHKGTVIYASDICGVVFLYDEHGKYYVSTNKKLAERIMLVSYSTLITATFEVVQRGSACAAVKVRLDMEEISDDEDDVPLVNKDNSYNQIREHTNTSNISESLEPIPFKLPPEDGELSVDSVTKEMASLAISNECASQPVKPLKGILRSARVVNSSDVNNNNNNDCTLHSTIDDSETDESKNGDKKKHQSGWMTEETTDCRANLEVEKVWYEFPERVDRILNSTDIKSLQKQSRLLNIWWSIPAKRNKTEYPFPCCGICYSILGTNKIKVITQRVGCFIKNDDPRRRGLPIAFFYVVGEGQYSSFEYSNLVCTLTSVGPVDPLSKEAMWVYARGYAALSPSKKPEDTWMVWNDYCGRMKCEVGCASEEFKIWKPQCKLVRFEAVTQNGVWIIKKLTEVRAPYPQQVNYFPADLFYLNDILPLKDKKQASGLPVFVSETLGNNRIVAVRDHTHFGTKYNGKLLWALVFVTWSGGRREFHALVIGLPERLNYEAFWAFADALKLRGWETKRKFSAVEEPPIPVEQ